FLEGVPNDGMTNRVVYPSILDYCTADLLRESKAAADSLQAHLQIHACQSLYEFHEVLHRTARTPIEWLADLGVLGPTTSLAHCFMTTAHPLSAYRGGRDLELLAATGTSIVHCPVAIGRRGNALHWLDSHQAAGVRVAIGTDTFPRDMLNELRHAQFMAKLISNDMTAGSARAVIRAATIDGADAIGRPDLGRLAVGKAADLIAINLRSLAIGPVRDPVDAALTGATPRDIERVVVNGRVVARDGVVPGVDVERLITAMQADGERAWAALPDYHWTRKPADEVFPRSFRVAAADEFP
ncbi:MAG: amidohydrolase family protein, partial [Dehalococcoidia bacterium]|nr:amidohydrolase family protein [Dehalococcoidia bacterium]